MFGLFNSGESKEGGDNNFVVTDDLRIAIEDAGLGEDPALREMIKTGFVSPNGKEWDPYEFIAQRKAKLEGEESGAEAPTNPTDNMVEHSLTPETELRRDLI